MRRSAGSFASPPAVSSTAGRPTFIQGTAFDLLLQQFALLLTRPHRQHTFVTEKTSCASASMLKVLRFNCTADRCQASIAPITARSKKNVSQCKTSSLNSGYLSIPARQGSGGVCYRFLLNPCAFVYILGYILKRAMLEASFYGLGAFGRSVGRVVCISDLIEVPSYLRLGCVE